VIAPLHPRARVIAPLRLAWRIQRWEFAFVVIGGLGLAAVAFWQAFDMRSMLTGCGTPSAASACEFFYPFQDTHGNVVLLTQMLIGLAPFVAGLLLGVPIVAQEIEHRTALLAWPLAGSRARWLAWRVMPAMIIGLVAMAVLAVAADLMAQAYLPKSDLGFLHHGSRGVPLVIRAMVVLALGVALGALTGRVLPALLVGIALCVGLSVGLGTALDRWLPSEVLTQDEAPGGLSNPLTTDVQYRMPSGEIISAQEGEIIVSNAYEAAFQAGEPEPDPATLPQEIYTGISAARHGEVVLRESLALGTLATGLFGVAALVVRRRRPE
jgi:hypothetical protein